jgi:hypothetical protein
MDVAYGVWSQTQRSPVNVLPFDEVGFCNMVLQGTDGTVGVFSFRGWFEVWLKPTYKSGQI